MSLSLHNRRRRGESGRLLFRDQKPLELKPCQDAGRDRRESSSIGLFVATRTPRSCSIRTASRPSMRRAPIPDRLRRACRSGRSYLQGGHRSTSDRRAAAEAQKMRNARRTLLDKPETSKLQNWDEPREKLSAMCSCGNQGLTLDVRASSSLRAWCRIAVVPAADAR